MKYTLEQQLAESRPEHNRGNKLFIARTMKAVKATNSQTTMTRLLDKKHTSTKQRLLMRFKSLPLAAAVALVIATFIVTGGCVYAVAHFVPSLIKIASKHISQRGTTEYLIPDFATCAHSTTGKFELNKDAPALSDDEVRKIVQARCELDWASSFVSQTWPSYGSESQEKDEIFYARPDMIGTLESVSKTRLVINVSGTTKTYTRADKQDIAAYANGQKVRLDSLKSDDTIFAIVRVAETHANKSALYEKDSVKYYGNDNPRTLGVIAALKLSLPAKYYGDMQQFITEIPPCDGNPGEYCPHTGFIDVFPRAGGEAANNTAYVDRPGNTMRTISGQVTALGSGTLSLKSSSGKEYTVTATADAFDDYNRHYAPNYTQSDAILKIGSTVFITYSQAPEANPRIITLDQMFSIGLQIDASNPKKGNIKQY